MTDPHFRIQRRAARAALLASACLGCLLLACGCSSTYDPATGDLRLDLRHRDPRVRIEAAQRCAVENRTDLLPRLVENLEDPDGAVRMFTGVALRKLTGRDFDYKPYGTLLEREVAVKEWKHWLASLKAPAADEPPGSVSAGGETGNKEGHDG